MAQKVEIGVFQIGKTVVNRAEVRRWLDFIGATEFEIPLDGSVSNPALLIALAGKRCYKSFQPGLNPNVTRIRSDYGEYFDNVLKSGHGSVLEHSVYNWAIENVSRVFTGEMNRHRAGWAISEGSMRFIRFEDEIPYCEPDSIRGPDTLGSEEKIALGEMDFESLHDALTRSANGVEQTLELPSIEEKKHATRIIFERAFDGQRDAYRCLVAIWGDLLAEKSKFTGKKNVTSMMRRIVGMGCATGGVWSGNIRALRHVITMRAAPDAEEEILRVFSTVAKMMAEDEPLLFGDFTQTPEGFWVPKYRKV